MVGLHKSKQTTVGMTYLVITAVKHSAARRCGTTA